MTNAVVFLVSAITIAVPLIVVMGFVGRFAWDFFQILVYQNIVICYNDARTVISSAIHTNCESPKYVRASDDPVEP